MANLFPKVLTKIEAQRDRIDVLEYGFPAECPQEPVIDASGDVLAVLTPVRDKHGFSGLIGRDYDRIWHFGR